MAIRLSNLAGWASGFNWYKYGAIAAVIAAALVLSYCSGKHNAQMDCEAEKTQVVIEKLRTVTKEVEVRVPVVQVREVESAKQRAEVKRLKEALDVAIANRPENPSCALSDSELDGFRKLSEKTRSTQ